jgi:putative methyltransferase (TIGR04325 family)
MQKVNQFNIWEGIYSSFEMAEKDKKEEGFSSSRYVAQAKLAATESLVKIKKKERIPLFHKQRFTHLASIIVSLLDLKREIEIIDFGGGLGIGYMKCLESIPNLDNRITYNIVELDEVCKEGIIFNDENDLPLRYSNSIHKNQKCDLVFCSSTLQYIKDWKILVEEFARTEAAKILLSDVFCGYFSNSFVTIQNYYESKIPHWFFSTSDLISEFEKYGYYLSMHLEATGSRAGTVDFLPMSNFPKSHRIETTSHLLFSNANVRYAKL